MRNAIKAGRRIVVASVHERDEMAKGLALECDGRSRSRRSVPLLTYRGFFQSFVPSCGPIPPCPSRSMNVSHEATKARRRKPGGDLQESIASPWRSRCGIFEPVTTTRAPPGECRWRRSGWVLLRRSRCFCLRVLQALALAAETKGFFMISGLIEELSKEEIGLGAGWLGGDQFAEVAHGF